MKRSLVFIAGLGLMMSMISCAGLQKPDPKVMACQAGCDEAYDSCVKKAKKSKAKKAACEVTKTACYNRCTK